MCWVNFAALLKYTVIIVLEVHLKNWRCNNNRPYPQLRHYLSFPPVLRPHVSGNFIQLAMELCDVSRHFITCSLLIYMLFIYVIAQVDLYNLSERK